MNTLAFRAGDVFYYIGACSCLFGGRLQNLSFHIFVPYGLAYTVETMFDYIHLLSILQTMAAVICLGGASLLFLRGWDSRSKRILAGIMSVWGLFYVARIVGTFLGSPELNFVRIDVANIVLLASGNLYLIILLLYPMEVVRPGWLNLKRTGILLLPYVLVTSVYYIVLYLLGQEPMRLYDMSQFREHIGEFNVWYRLLMILSIVAYLIFLFRQTWHYKEFYSQWCRDNYSDDKNMNILWLRQYGIGVMLIGVAYFWALFNGDTYCFMIHNLTVQCFFCYTLYKGLFHDNPYTENFFSCTLDEAEALRKAELSEMQSTDGGACLVEEGNSLFLNKLPAYREEIAGWMQEKKPYLNPNFKLMDVAEILPLNRTYLSRVFNEGFGNSFSDVVRDYRIREAEWMLVNRQDIPVGHVGELCGFSSPSAFHRAFVQSHDGLTPNRYRKQAEK